MSRKRAIGLCVLVILAITLTPKGNGAPLPFTLEIGAGRRWLADGILNLFLFVPFGLALAWKGRSLPRAVIISLLLSAAVEIGQLWIPGRDSALSDVLFNTAGAAIGALLAQRPGIWLLPGMGQSRALVGLAVAFLTAIVILTAVLSSPMGNAFEITRSRNEFMLAYTSRANAVGLDAPVYWLSAPDSIRGSALAAPRRDRARWYLAFASLPPRVLGPTVGDGWALLAYPDAIGRRWARELSALWLLLLCVPVGYWARERASVIGGLVGIALVLILVPMIFGIVPTPFMQWIGALCGVVAGSGLRMLLRRPVRRLLAATDDQ